MWKVYDNKTGIKPYATRFWQKRLYHDGHGENEIFVNVWEYPPIEVYQEEGNHSYTLEIDVPDNLSPSGKYLRIETFSYSEINLPLWDQAAKSILVAMFPWIRKDLDI